MLVTLLLIGCATDAEFYAPNSPPEKHATWKAKLDVKANTASRQQVMDQVLHDMLQTHRPVIIEPHLK